MRVAYLLSAERLLLLIGLAFVFVNALALSIVRSGQFLSAHLLLPLLWLVVIAPGQLALERYQPQRDRFLFPIYAFLVGWGLILQDRLAPAFVARQALWFVLGSVTLLALAILPRNLRWLRRYRYTLLLIGIVLLLATLLFGVNPANTGPALWLPLPLLNAYFQPSELLKLLLIFFFASYFADRGRVIRARQDKGIFATFPYLAPLFLMWGFCLLLLVWQRDLGAATIFFVLFLAMLYAATGRSTYLVIGAVLLLLAGAIGYVAYDVVALRVDAWINPWLDVHNRSFQVVQSLYALAAGGIFGEGVGQGYPTFIPVVHSDFVFAAIGEEWGLIGALTVAACFTVVAQRGLRIALLSKRPFHKNLALGLTTLLSVQALLIMGGVTRLLPLTGVTLPFLSYGGSALLMACVMVGLLLFLGRGEVR